jgi:two-component system response regulator YesN
MRTLTYTGDIVVVAEIGSEKGIFDFTDDCDRLCKMAKKICKANVTAGIGCLCNNPSQIPESYQSAKSALSYRVLYGNMRAINAAEIGEEERLEKSHWEDDAIRKILRAMKLNEKEQLPKAVDSFMEGMTEAKLSMSDFRVILMKLVVELTDFMGNYQLSMEDVLEGEGEDLLQVLLGQESSEALGEKLTTYCTRIRRLMNERRKDSTKSFVTKAVEYVQDHYADQDIGIESVCAYLNVSSAYFSTAFKKETQKTFINYLTEYRMEKAVELLTKSDEKTYVIADKVGYSDPNYFSYVFKKQFGVSPSKYRSSQEEG